MSSNPAPSKAKTNNSGGRSKNTPAAPLTGSPQRQQEEQQTTVDGKEDHNAQTSLSSKKATGSAKKRLLSRAEESEIPSTPPPSKKAKIGIGNNNVLGPVAPASGPGRFHRKIGWGENILVDEREALCVLSRDGTYILCRLCLDKNGQFSRINPRRPFDVYRWNEHKKLNKKHLAAEAAKEASLHNTSNGPQATTTASTNSVTSLITRTPSPPTVNRTEATMPAHADDSATVSAPAKGDTGDAASKKKHSKRRSIVHDSPLPEDGQVPCYGMMQYASESIKLFSLYGSFDDLGISFNITSEGIYRMHSRNCHRVFQADQVSKTHVRRRICVQCSEVEQQGTLLRKRVDRASGVSKAIDILQKVHLDTVSEEEVNILKNISIENQHMNASRREVSLIAKGMLHLMRNVTALKSTVATLKGKVEGLKRVEKQRKEQSQTKFKHEKEGKAAAKEFKPQDQGKPKKEDGEGSPEKVVRVTTLKAKPGMTASKRAAKRGVGATKKDLESEGLKAKRVPVAPSKGDGGSQQQTVQDTATSSSNTVTPSAKEANSAHKSSPAKKFHTAEVSRV